MAWLVPAIFIMLWPMLKDVKDKVRTHAAMR